MRARVKVTGDDVHSSHDTASPVKFCRKWTPRTPTSSGARRDRVAAALSSGRPRRVLGENCHPSPGHARTGGEEARGRVPATQSEVPRRGHSGDVTPRPPTPHVPEPEPAARSPSPGPGAADTVPRLQRGTAALGGLHAGHGEFPRLDSTRHVLGAATQPSAESD